jgi:hypothetical protein
MPSEREVMDDESRRRIAAEKRRVAREQHLARLTPEQRANVGKGFALSFGALSKEDGDIFEKALWDGRRI